MHPSSPRTLIVIFIGVFASCAFAQQSSIPPPSPADYAADLSAAKDAKKFVLKGFFLGMSTNDLSYQLKAYPEAFNFFAAHHSQAYLAVAEQLTGEKPTEFWDDTDHRISEFHWNSDVVNSLFNASDMTAQDFVQAFLNAYPIDAMDPVNPDNGKSYWKYSSPDGWEIIIWMDKSLTLRVIPKPAERKFN